MSEEIIIEPVKKAKRAVRKVLTPDQKEKVIEKLQKKKSLEISDDVCNEIADLVISKMKTKKPEIHQEGKGAEKPEPVIEVPQPQKEEKKIEKVKPEPVYKPEPELDSEEEAELLEQELERQRELSRYGRKAQPIVPKDSRSPTTQEAHPITIPRGVTTTPVNSRYGKK